MTVWKKLDVQGDLQPIVAKARGKVAVIYKGIGEDLYVTSHREGRHGIVSLHPDGWAFDIRKPTTKLNEVVNSIRVSLGTNFDIVIELDHIHIEYDPKNVK